MDVVNERGTKNPVYENDLGRSEKSDSNFEPPVEYDTLTFDRTSSENPSSQYATLERKKCSKKRTRTIVLITTIVVLIVVALSVTLGILLGSNSKAESPLTCPELSEKQHVIFAASTDTRVGDSINITCTKSNKLVGPSNIICLSSGKWSAEPKCIPRECTPFKLPENAYLLGNEEGRTLIETELNILCLPGFNLKGNSTVKCLYNETWSTAPSCEAIDCGLPASVRNGKINNITSTTFNTSLQVLCSEGFTLEGNMTMYCTQNGTWTPSPKCSLIDCGTPPNISSGVIKSLTGTSFNNTFSVMCNEGYLSSGPTSVRCSSDGNWTFLPSCGPVSCGTLTPPQNGQVIYINSTTTFGASARITCDNGYFVQGKDVAFCLSSGKWSNITRCSQTALPIDCFEIRNRYVTTTGIYTVSSWNTKTVIQVYCDMDTDNGGWTVFQNRFDGSVDFYQNFSTYESGFGGLNGEFWLGLKYIQEMTADSRTELRIDLTAADGTTAYEVFQNFYLTAGPNYTLFIDPGTGTAGQGLSYHKGMPFTTFDRDVDRAGSFNCAVYSRGGWWYNFCANVNLNAQYVTPGTIIESKGDSFMVYYNFKKWESLKTTKMMFRRSE